MKYAVALLLLAGPVVADEAAAPAAPAPEVKEAAPSPVPPEKTIPDRKADKEGAVPASGAPEDVTTPPSPELKAAAQKAAETVVSSPKLEETKPLPKGESARFAGSEEEWAFVKSSAETADSGTRDAAIENLRLFARRFPESAHAPEAFILLADLRAKKGDWQPALAALLHAVYEYAGSPVELRAKSEYMELAGNKASRRLRPVLNEFVNGNDAAEKSDRLSALWRKVAEKAPDAFYEAAAEEIREFFVRFPEHKDNDKLQAALARLHSFNDNPAAAVTAWRKLLALYPDSDLRAQAQLSIGDLYAGALREPKKAIDSYQELIAQYPRAGEVLPALQGSARLFEDKIRQYDLAVQMDEEIVKTFPKSPASLAALKSIARLQRERLSKPDEAINTLRRLSSMHGGQDGVDALLLAAAIYRSDLKDYVHEAASLHQVADDYALAREAPQALYDAAGVYEDDVKDLPKASAVYKEVAVKYPSTRLAKKASDRAEKLAAVK